MAKKEVKKEKSKTKPKKNNELAIKVLGVMEALQKNGVIETTSTKLWQEVGTKNRGAIRAVMRRLSKEGKVVIEEEKHGQRRQFKYKLA